ncbi:MAG: DUF4434 domain-containing protein [Bacteroidales bacterium]|nr:DUF4434 domain-containing protein [Bacteroidales bacterium]
MMKKLAIGLLIPIITLCCKGNTPDPEPDPGPDPTPVSEVTAITGSFIQQWYVQKWSQTDWNKEMSVLSEAGMEYLIFTPLSKDGSDADYASLERCLSAAKAKGIKVMVGTNSNTRWWDASITSAWLNGQMEEGLAIAREAYKRFKTTYPDTFYGWYWDWEIDNVNWGNRKQMLADAWNISLDGLSALDAGMPLLFSPFMNPSMGTASQYRDFWKSLFPSVHFRKGDIFAPQDCAGGFAMPVSTIKSWLYQLSEAAKTVDGLEFWANLENFCQYSVHGENKFATAPFNRIVDQIAGEKAFASRLICFAYSHYYSPVLVREDYHKAYLHYLKTGEILEVGKPSRVSSVSQEVGTGVALRWVIATKTNVDGFSLYKNGKLLLKLQASENTYPDYFFDYDGKASDAYQIATYNINGVESEKVTF